MINDFINVEKCASGIIIFFLFLVNFKIQVTMIDIKDELIQNQKKTIEIQNQINSENRRINNLLEESTNKGDTIVYSNNIIIVEQNGDSCYAI